MKFNIRWVANRFAEVHLEHGATVIELGLLDGCERHDLCVELQAAVENLKSRDSSPQAHGEGQ